MNISYRFSSQRGDIVADEAMLERAFATGPLECHQFMTLRDFFDAVKRFLLSEGGTSLNGILFQVLNRDVQTEEIDEIIIRYEKYGTLYQICAIDAVVGGTVARMCAGVAFSTPAKETLDGEYELLSQLEKKAKFGRLPKVYKKDWIEVEKDGQRETLFAVLLEWFDGYEEWHFQRLDGSTRAFLWDMRAGYRFLSESQTADIIRQASCILTVYYDFESTRRIAPWHHGGGDFIVRASDERVDVRLITARGYEPMVAVQGERALQALCDFVIELATKMRLDKREGMGESTWADRFVVEAALEGVFEGLRIREARGDTRPLLSSDVLKDLESMDAEGLRSLIKRQLAEVGRYDESDCMVVLNHLERHVAEIGAAIQSLRPAFP